MIIEIILTYILLICPVVYLLYAKNKNITELQHKNKETNDHNLLLWQIIHDKREEIRNLQEELRAEKLRNTLENTLGRL